MARIDNITFMTYFAQVGASAFGAIILIYVTFVVCQKYCSRSGSTCGDYEAIHFFRWSFFLPIFWCMDFFYSYYLHAYSGTSSKWLFVAEFVDSHKFIGPQFVFSLSFQHDRIYDCALDLKWNEMQQNEQKMYLLFIQRCQSPTLLTVGGFYPLNLDTCLAVCMREYRIKLDFNYIQFHWSTGFLKDL